MNLFRGRVDLFEAINRSEWQKVKEAVTPGKANLRDSQYDATILHWSVNEGHVPTVEHLLTCGADVHARDGRQLRTPLHWAAGNGQLGVIRELIFWGARAECSDSWKKIALHWAAYRGHISSVEELVSRGSATDAVDGEGHVPGSEFHSSVPEEARNAIQAAVKKTPVVSDNVLRSSNISAELLLETLKACQSWGELFENRHYEELSRECKDHKDRLRGVIQNRADEGKVDGLEPYLAAMDLLNSALSLNENMRTGLVPVPLNGGDVGRGQGGNKSGMSFPPRAGGGGSGGGTGGTDRSAPNTPLPRKKHVEQSQESAISKSGSDSASLRLYQLPEVREACGGFDTHRCIGEGGFGKVYRGSMMGVSVAVKKLDETGLQGREQFFREVEVLSTCRHENIVPLLGVCMEPPCLVYRLMPNNSLRHHLDKKALRGRLGWRLRVRVTVNVCKGLEYLHSESTDKPKVIHRDIKPENILLDEYFNARLSDFGISRVGNSDGGSGPGGGGGAAAALREAQTLEGTFGYMDPVYQTSGNLDERSDIFSLGVVMMELLTGDPVHCPEKQPPGLVDRVSKSVVDGTLKSTVDKTAMWSKNAAKAYTRIAIQCCSPKPEARPSLHEVAERVSAVHDTGRLHEEAASRAAAKAAEAAGSVLLELSDPGSSGAGIGTGDQSPGNPFLPVAKEEVAIAGLSAVIAKPPPPYGDVVGDSYSEVAGEVTGSPLSPAGAAAQVQKGVAGNRGCGEGVDLLTGNIADQVSAGVVTAPSGTPGAFWGEATGVFQNLAAAAEGTRREKNDRSFNLSKARAPIPPPLPPRSEIGGNAQAQGQGQMGKEQEPSTSIGQKQRQGECVSCSLSSSFKDYRVDLRDVFRAARCGGVLSSNARLMSLCHLRGNNQGFEGNQSTSRVSVAGQSYVSVLDLWHKGRTVRYPTAAKSAAMSPNRSESVIAVHGSGSLQVYSIPQRRRLQQQSVPQDLCMWRWLSSSGLALVTDEAIFYWNVVIDGPTADEGGELGGEGADTLNLSPGKAMVARLRRPTKAFVRRCTRMPSGDPGYHYRAYDYQASVDGKWGLLCCAVAATIGESVAIGLSGVRDRKVGWGRRGRVKVDLYSFEQRQNFTFDALGAALMTMPGSSPPINLLGIVVCNDLGFAELRVLDLDQSLVQAEGKEALQGVGWLLVTTHVIADEDLHLADAHLMVHCPCEEGGEGGKITGVANNGVAQGGEGRPLVSPLLFLRQWTVNSNVLFIVGCHGLLLLLDVVTGVELTRIQACPGPVVEAAVDPDVGDLVVVTMAEVGAIHRLNVRPNALREYVALVQHDPELAARVSATTGYERMR